MFDGRILTIVVIMGAVVVIALGVASFVLRLRGKTLPKVARVIFWAVVSVTVVALVGAATVAYSALAAS